MNSFRLIQISDTHLSRARPHFVGNYEIAAQHVADEKPDMVIHSGDIAVDAPTRPDDLVFAREALNSLGVPCRTIAGNHDVGDNPGDNDYQPGQRINAPWISAFEAVFGPSQWQFEAAGWHILGINAQLFLSGLDEESAQMVWLEEALDRAGDKPVALFCHKPLLHKALDEQTDVPFRYVPLACRPRLNALLQAANVRLFSCGHVHQSRDHVVDGIRHVWAPATAFTLPDAMQPRVGVKRCGLVQYVFTPGDVQVETVFPETMQHHELKVIKDAYA